MHECYINLTYIYFGIVPDVGDLILTLRIWILARSCIYIGSVSDTGNDYKLISQLL